MTWSADLAVLADRAARWNTPQAHAEFRSSSVARMREYQAHAAFAAACSPERIKVLCELAEAARQYVSAEDEWHLRQGMGRQRVPYRIEMDFRNRWLRSAVKALEKEQT